MNGDGAIGTATGGVIATAMTMASAGGRMSAPSAVTAGASATGTTTRAAASAGAWTTTPAIPGGSAASSWGGGQSYAAGDWPSYASDYDYRRDFRGGGSDYGDYGRDYGRGYGGSRSERGPNYGGGYGSGAYGSIYGAGTGYGYGRDERGWGGGGPDYERNSYARSYGGDRGENDRNWFDKAGDEVQSWFGDRDAERRRQRDHLREGDHRGRGPTGYRRSDERIREDVCDRLSDNSWLDASNIELQVHDGEVTLSGTVHDRHDKRHAEDLAERVSGVHHVQNNLRVKTTTGNLATSGTGQAHSGTGTASATTGAGQSRTSKETL